MTTSYKQTIGNTTHISEVKPKTGTFEIITLPEPQPLVEEKQTIESLFLELNKLRDKIESLKS
jgi:hypothetical protein